jgi:hypothetical protein
MRARMFFTTVAGSPIRHSGENRNPGLGGAVLTLVSLKLAGVTKARMDTGPGSGSGTGCRYDEREVQKWNDCRCVLFYVRLQLWRARFMGDTKQFRLIRCR